MYRDVDLKEISDGRLYRTNDMVKADCHDCQDCDACCHGMGQSILIDPYDMYQLERGLMVSAGTLLSQELALGLEGGLILPHIKMQESSDACAFLRDGRCGVHDFRPGICRLFPLGRYYDDGELRYILQTKECLKTNRTKIKVEKWLGIPDIRRYEKFTLDWHYHILDLQEKIYNAAGDEEVKNLNLDCLNRYFATDYDINQDFYPQFYERFFENTQ